MTKIVNAIGAAMMLGAAMPAPAATTYTFDTTSSAVTGSSGSGAGNSYTFTSGTEHVVVTGYQSSQASGNPVNSANVGVYSAGLGVIGNGDFSGNYNYHQVDNVNGYTDFLLLTFDHAVTLSNIGLASFNMGTGSSYLASRDNDLAFQALTAPFNSASVTTSGWTTVNGTGTDGVVATGSNAVSRQWLVGAAFNSANNDGFKVSSLKVSNPVPEPATWAMMLVGFGAIGGSMRLRRKTVSVTYA